MDPFNFIEIIEKTVPVFKEMYNTKKWKDMFINIGEEILDLEHDKGELFEQLNILFSEDNLKLIAKDNRNTGYVLIEQAREQLVKYFTKKDLYNEERQRYIDLFIYALRTKLETEFPEEYDKVFLNDFRHENKQDHLEISAQLNKLDNKVDELKICGLNIITCDELNEWYVTNTKNGCTLELFNHENKEFVNELLSQLSKKTIGVKGENVFESVAYIAYLFLNDERFHEYKEKLRIVEDEESWRSLSKCSFSNYIFINRFTNNDHLAVIENNKCIFVHGKNDYSKAQDLIALNKRYFRNLITKVTQCGFDHQEAYEISKASRNNYTILLRRLFLGKQKDPLWANPKNYEILLPAMILNQWLDRDAVLFELLLDNNIKYNEYLKKLNEINDAQDPFYVVYETWFRRNKYLVSDAEDAWDYFTNFIDDSLFIKLEPMIDLIFNEIDPKFDLPTEQHYYASVLGYVPQFSDELKNGFVETLIYLSRPESKISHSIKQKIKDIIYKVETRKEWFAISEYLPLIFEINPDALLSKFESELNKKDSGLINLFIEKSDDFISGRNYYTHVIWTLEKALYSESYVYRSIVILSKLMDFDIEYKISNSPLNTLYNALVAWSHEYIYTIDEKVEFVRYIVENRKNGWQLLKKLLPSNNGGTISSLSRPKYNPYLLSDDLKFKKQIYNTYLNYYQIALDNINSDVEKLCVFYENTLFFNFEIYERLKETSYELIRKFSDQEKYKLYKKVFSLISRNRHFQRAEWAQSEEFLEKLETEVLNKIEFQDKSYKYQYMFESYHDILLNPVVFDRDDNHDSIKENHKLEEELRRGSIKILVELNVNWSVFLSRFEKDASNTIGIYLAEVKNDIAFIEDISKSLADNDKFSILAAYYGSLYSIFGLKIVDSFIRSKKLNDKQYLELMFSRIKIDKTTLEFLDELSEKHKEIFWKINNGAHLVKEDIKDYALDNYIKYRNANALIELVDYYSYSTDKLINVLEIVKESNITYHNMASYHIERIFEKIYEDDFPVEEISQQVMNLEIYFLPIFSEKNGLRYLKYSLSKYPKLAADLIELSYKRECANEKKVLDEKEKRLAEISHSILLSVKFSPTNDGVGLINYNTLKDWCNEYISAVTHNNQKTIGLQYLGHFLANTNIVKEGEYPQESVKQVIEDVFDEELLIGFSLEIGNSLGVRTISDGSDFLDLAKKYNDYAHNSKMYPQTYRILKRISENFYRDYESENASAKYDD